MKQKNNKLVERIQLNWSYSFYKKKPYNHMENYRDMELNEEVQELKHLKVGYLLIKAILCDM